MRARVRRTWPRSGAGYVDGDGDGVADDVPDGRVADEAGELGELVVVEVAGDVDGDPDLLVAGADVAVQAEEAVQVQVALDRGLHAVQGDAAGGGVVDDRAGYAGREGVQDVLDGVRCPVLAEQDRRLVGVHGKRLGAGGVFLAGAVEVLDRRAAVAAVDPVVAGPELKPRQRGFGGDVVDRPGEAVEVDAVDDAGDVHGELPWLKRLLGRRPGLRPPTELARSVVLS